MARSPTLGSVRKELPKDEIFWVRHHSLNGDEYVVTSPPDRSFYNLHQVIPEGYQFWGRDKSPPGLYAIIEERSGEKDEEPQKKRRAKKW